MPRAAEPVPDAATSGPSSPHPKHSPPKLKLAPMDEIVWSFRSDDTILRTDLIGVEAVLSRIHSRRAPELVSRIDRQRRRVR